MSFRTEKNGNPPINLENSNSRLRPLWDYLNEDYNSRQKTFLISGAIGFKCIHSTFPRDIFLSQIKNAIDSDDNMTNDLCTNGIDILQTFAPNLDYFSKHLTEALKKDIKVRILLAWPHSRIVPLREEAIKQHGKQGKK